MYHFYQQSTIADFSPASVEKLYDQGFVFTRQGRGVMQQIKSVRVDLARFELSSENRRILKKSAGLKIDFQLLSMNNYSWQIGKMAKDFYDAKAGQGTMSVNKIKEMFTEPDKSNMNCFLEYSLLKTATEDGSQPQTLGYCLCFNTQHIMHYAYPFYGLRITDYGLLNSGMAMMLNAIIWAKEQGRRFIYLGSYNKYKLQFKGVEWRDSDQWHAI